jgi:hypothetical protein
LPVLVIAPRARFAPLECSDGTRRTKAIVRGAEPKRRASPSSAAMVRAVRSSIPAETPEVFDAGPERLERQQVAEIVFDGAEASHGLVHRAKIGAVRLIERRQRPDLCAEPRVVPVRPGFFRRREPAAMPKQEFRQPMPGPQQISANIFAAPQ